ncbi:MAG: dihydropteroate synthase [Verrucomicrobiota bacterium]
MLLHARGRTITFPRRPLVMGIVNVNDDSFCGDGTLDLEAALAQARRQAAEGADIIDAGAESARTNRAAISLEEETARFTGFIRGYQDWCARAAGEEPPFDSEQIWPPLLSLNTWRPEVVEAVLPLGGDLLNDIGALPDDRNARLCAEHGAALLIMHSIGEPKQPHTHVGYPDIMAELDRFFTEKLALCAAAGLPAESVILDPGVDFAKQREDNLTIFRDLRRLQKFQRPVLLPVSRKTVIGEVLNLPDPLDRDAGTLACIARGVSQGAQIFRVHQVQAAMQAVKVLWTLESGGIPDPARSRPDTVPTA